MINDAQLYSINTTNNTLYTLLCLNEKKIKNYCKHFIMLLALELRFLREQTDDFFLHGEL